VVVVVWGKGREHALHVVDFAQHKILHENSV